jgi:hypothetical protein
MTRGLVATLCACAALALPVSALAQSTTAQGTTSAPSGSTTDPSQQTTDPSAVAPTTSTPAATPPAASTPPATAPAAQQPTATTTSGNDRAAVVLLVLVAALALLALGLWLVASWQAWDPPWLARWRHATGEAGWRAGNAWAEFTDWLRLGR